MIEYIFFSTELRDRFVDFVRQHGSSCECSDDPLGLVVAVPEDIPEALSDEIEAFYESLEDEQEDMSAADGDLHRLAGFGFKLPSGEARMLPIEPDMANRLMAHFSLEEIQALLNDVARYTLEPADEHLCHILAGRKAEQGD